MPGSEADHGELNDLARRLVDAWNRGDARAFACLFTPAADYVTGAGERVQGRDAISALLVPPALQVSIVGPPAIRCDARSGELTFLWSSVDADGRPRQGRIMCACIRQGSGWLIESLHNNEVGDAG